jgi:hypothetical protein
MFQAINLVVEGHLDLPLDPDYTATPLNSSWRNHLFGVQDFGFAPLRFRGRHREIKNKSGRLTE